MDKQAYSASKRIETDSRLQSAYRELDKMTAAGSERSSEPPKSTNIDYSGACRLTLITCQDDFVAALKRRRAELRLTLFDVDHRTGFQDGYTAHLESPHSRSGRNSLKLNPMAALWLEALGLTLAVAQVSSDRGV